MTSDSKFLDIVAALDPSDPTDAAAIRKIWDLVRALRDIAATTQEPTTYSLACKALGRKP